ncbi:hypothetical protein AB0368_32290 [Actinoplanes sp. NPDC051475]|uniref:hypothetical protein n=1 Tax=Actinoplanes sp. NPDC051475 TaxID=3157225 RepID=UPI00344E8106
MDRENHLHEQLLRIVAPLVMGPCGAQPAQVVRLAGIVRAGTNQTRIVLLAGAQAPARIAVEFRLTGDDGTELDVDAAVDWIRTLTHADLAATAGERDSHDNIIVAADTLGFSANHRATEYDINYFSMLRQLLYGGGALWFEDIFTLHGYLLTGPGRHRLYINNSKTGTITGIDLPLTQADGTIWSGQGGSFPVVLPSLVRDDELQHQTKITAVDDYCSVVYDMSDWVLPTPAPEPEY